MIIIKILKNNNNKKKKKKKKKKNHQKIELLTYYITISSLFGMVLFSKMCIDEN